ncbi:hypothetical protein BKA63DRAFT_551482 [Paraphoma chrysanthemicola]|nr:hypothetical protein BKA63DRAFT_551482 [Paraphoma chrysanthemicola]
MEQPVVGTVPHLEPLNHSTPHTHHTPTLTSPEEDTSAQTQAVLMARDPKAIKCKSCAKVLATTSSTGLVPARSSGEPQDSCVTCQQFQPLYDAMLAAEKEYASYADRRDNYRPKQDAFVNFKKTRLEFNNWLLTVETLDKASEEALHHQSNGQEQAGATDSDAQRGSKRARSSNSRLQLRTSSPNGLSGTDSLPERKRLKFSESVEFRDDYRPSNRYSRNDEAYEKGRHAPPEGSKYLDTSGSAVSFLKFTGAKKVGKGWVDEEQAKKKKKNAEDVTTQVGNENEEEDEDNAKATDSLLDPRSQRLMRRRSASTKKEWTPGQPSTAVCIENTDHAKFTRSVTASEELTPNHPMRMVENEHAEHAERPKISSTNELLAVQVLDTDDTDETLKYNGLDVTLSVEPPQASHESIGNATEAEFSGPPVDSNHDDCSTQSIIYPKLCGAAQGQDTHRQDQDAPNGGQVEPKYTHTNSGDATVVTEATTALVLARREAQAMQLTTIDPAVSPTNEEQGPVMQRVAATVQNLPEGGQEAQQRLHGGLGVAAGTVPASHDDANSHVEAKSSLAVPAYQNVEIDYSNNAQQGFASNAVPTSPTAEGGNPQPRHASDAPHPDVAASESSLYAPDAQHLPVNPVKPAPAITAAMIAGAPEIDAVGGMRVMVAREGKGQFG